MALAATPTWQVDVSVADVDNNIRKFSFNLPNALTFAAANTAALVVINAAITLINGVITKYNLSGGYFENTYPATPADANSDSERKAVFVFATTVYGQLVRLELPSIKPDYVVDGSNVLDVANADVDAFVQAMIDTGIGAGNSPVSAYGTDITGLFSVPRKIHRASSKG